MLKLDMPVTSIKNVGAKRAELYKKLNIETVEDLIYHFPRSYIDFTNQTTIDGCQIGDTVTISAKIIEKFIPLRVRGGMTIFRFIISDISQNAITVTLFNNKYAFSSIKVGQEYVFYGKLSGTMFRPEMSAPLFIPKSQANFMQPNYHLTAGLSHKMIAVNVKSALDSLESMPKTCIPQEILIKERLSDIKSTFYDIHFPTNIDDAENARKLFILEELLCLQLGMSGLKQRAKKRSSLVLEDVDIDLFYESLPFSPTNAQKKAISSALVDMQSGNCMNRLLQGDVGSGKTLVAAALFYIIFKNGGQCAFMAPTEILASQHFNSLTSLLAPFGVKISLLTGSTTAKKRRDIISNIQNGEIDLVCGTHALIEKDIEFKNLALVITDEQHRFGVSQRASLISKGLYPHTLIMSATPIPRSLALTIYGDLDISILDELPSGRKQVKTYLIDSAKRERAYGFLEKEIQNGRQVYIVCPAVDESILEIESAIQYHEKLCSVFIKRNVALLHGKMKSAEKDQIMNDFKDGKIDILVSTTVIEVGVDVANATIMMIENAERFGLSQLHQLRGRVGRGDAQSHCILVSDNNSDTAKERLKIMCKTNDGFEISKHDLKQRGPGDFFGDRQHGLPPMKSADLISDSILLEKAQKYSAEILSKDPKLELPEHFELKTRVNSLFKKLNFARSN